MSKRQVLMLLGALTMILLFLGFPLAWDRFFALAIGAAVIGISYALGPKEKKQEEPHAALAAEMAASAAAPESGPAPDAATVPDGLAEIPPAEPITGTMADSNS